MISRYDVIKYLEKHQDELQAHFDKELDACVTPDGRVLCTIDQLTQSLRKDNHCDFECIYSCHASLDAVYRCKECGTVIFTGDDERYDPLLRCPTCGGYHHHGDFWTKEEIEADEEKQRQIKGMEEYMRYEDEAYRRRKARGGLYDWQLFDKTYYGKKHCYTIEITVNNITESKIKGLALKISVGDKDDDGISYAIKRWYTIPLGITAIYRYWILPYSKKYPEEFRKYHFWQKKPKKEEEAQAA